MSWYLLMGLCLVVNIECTLVDFIAESVGVQNITIKYCEMESIHIYLFGCVLYSYIIIYCKWDNKLKNDNTSDTFSGSIGPNLQFCVASELSIMSKSCDSDTVTLIEER